MLARHPLMWHDFSHDDTPFIDISTHFIGIFTSCLGVDMPNLGDGMPNLGVGMPNLGVRMPNLDGGISIFNDCMPSIVPTYSTKAQFFFQWYLFVKPWQFCWHNSLTMVLGTAFHCLDHSNKIINIFGNLILLNMFLTI